MVMILLIVILVFILGGVTGVILCEKKWRLRWLIPPALIIGYIGYIIIMYLVEAAY